MSKSMEKRLRVQLGGEVELPSRLGCEDPMAITVEFEGCTISGPDKCVIRLLKNWNKKGRDAIQ